jgi:glyoxylase-like metal-dependent hydrolase (beta-lactamase superfamily II)
MNAEPRFVPVADGVEMLDTGMAGQRQLNAVYLVAADAPTLVESGPGADIPLVLAALAARGVGAGDLAHVVVTHIHLDHAGGTGALHRSFPTADVWVHERGAPHLADPERLVASTARTYGTDRMRRFFGDTLPVDPARIHAVTDGDRIALGGRTLEVLHTPGHASHHVALADDDAGAVFTGEAIGSYLPWVDVYRPALPPPEVDVEAALASIERIRSRARILLTSHFGPIANAAEGCERAAARIRTWSEAVRRALADTDDVDRIAEVLRELASAEHLADAGTPIDLSRYDALGSVRMNATGLSRYWKKRWDREGGEAQPPS